MEDTSTPGIVAEFRAAFAAALDVVRARNPVFLTPGELRALTLEVTGCTHQLDGVLLGLVAVGDAVDVGDVDGSASMAVWLAHHTRTDRPVAHAQVRLARALEDQRVETGAAMARGHVSLEQAQAIVASLDRLPTDLDRQLVSRGEKHLIALAADHDPKRLRVLGHKLLEVIAPEIAEDRLRRQVEADEAAAYARTRLTMWANGDGTTTGRFTLPDLNAAMLTTALDAITAPRKQRPDTTTDRTGDPADPADQTDPADPADQTVQTVQTDQDPGFAPTAEWPADAATRRGKAFAQLLEHLPVDKLGDHGSTTATVVVTMTLEELTEKLSESGDQGLPGLTGLTGIATLDDGTPIPASTARKLACEAGIIPLVLGGPTVIADRGRTQRLFTHQQRISLNLRDKRCRADGCTIPAAWTEAHHLTPWAKGGRTDLGDGILLCGHHHRLIHSADYAHHHDPPTNTVQFHRRT